MRISRNLWLVSITSLLNDVSSEMVYPLIGFFLTGSLGASPLVVGIIEGISESLASFLKIASGWWSDRIRHRKNFAIAGYAISIVGKSLLGFAWIWGVVLGGRVLDKVGKGVRTAPRDALIADEADPAHHGRAFGFHRMMDTSGAVLGVVLALLALRAWGESEHTVRTLLRLSLVPSIIAVGVLMLVREKRHEAPDAAGTPRRPFPLHPVKAWHAMTPRLRAFMGVWFLFNLGASSDMFLFLRAKDAGATIPQVVAMYLVFNVVCAAASEPAGRLSDRIGRRTVLVTGCGLYGVVYALFAWSTSRPHDDATLPILFAFFALYGIQRALTEGVAKALIADLSPPQSKATMLGLHECLVGIAVLLASLIAGFLWESAGHSSPFWFAAVCAATGAAGLSLVLVGKTDQVAR